MIAVGDSRARTRDTSRFHNQRCADGEIRSNITCRMPARATFTDAGVAYDADGALAPTAQLVAKLRLAIDAGGISEGATLPSIRTGAAELGVHPNTLRKVYAALEAQGYATTRHGSGTVAHVRDAAGAAAVRRIADGALASARGAGADAQLVLAVVRFTHRAGVRVELRVGKRLLGRRLLALHLYLDVFGLLVACHRHASWPPCRSRADRDSR